MLIIDELKGGWYKRQGDASIGSTTGPPCCSLRETQRQPARKQITNRKQLTWFQNKPDQQRVKALYRQSGIQHACSGGSASAVVCSGSCGPGESRGEGSEAVRSRVPEGRRLHLRRLPLEEILQ